MAMRLSVRWKKDRKLQFRLALFTGGRSSGAAGWYYSAVIQIVVIILLTIKRTWYIILFPIGNKKNA